MITATTLDEMTGRSQLISRATEVREEVIAKFVRRANAWIKADGANAEALTAKLIKSRNFLANQGDASDWVNWRSMDVTARVDASAGKVSQIATDAVDAAEATLPNPCVITLRRGQKYINPATTWVGQASMDAADSIF